MTAEPTPEPVVPNDRRRWRARRAVLTALPLLLAVVLGACSSGGDTGAMSVTGEAKVGQDLWKSKGCSNCHTVNGNRSEGPTWKGLYGSTVTLRDGTTVTADDAYLTQAIREPNSQVVQGFAPLMPKTQMSDDELRSIIAFMQALK